MSYYEILNANLTSENFGKVKNQKISVNGQETIVDGYTLSLTEEQLNNLIIKILEQLKVDENIKLESEEQRNKFNEKIDEIIIANSETEFDTENLIVFTIFEKDGKVVSSSINDNSFAIVFEMYGEEEKILNINSTNFETEKTYSIVVKSTNNSINVEIPLTENQMLMLDYSKTKEDSIINQEFNIKYETETQSFKFNINGTIEENADIELKEIQEDEIVEIDEEKSTKAITQLTEVIVGKGILSEAKEAKEAADEAKKEEKRNLAELELSLLKMDFESLTLTDLPNEEVMDYMEKFKKYVIDYEVISNKVLRLKLDTLESNEDKYMTIYNMVEKNDENKYNIELEYESETEIINGILLTII